MHVSRLHFVASRFDNFSLHMLMLALPTAMAVTTTAQVSPPSISGRVATKISSPIME
jgi:hypothetical protein